MTEADRFWIENFAATLSGEFTTTEAQKDNQLSIRDLSTFERRTVEDVQNELGNINSKPRTVIDDDLFFPKEKVFKEGDTVATGRCVGTVQTTPEKLLAWMYVLLLPLAFVAQRPLVSPLLIVCSARRITLVANSLHQQQVSRRF